SRRARDRALRTSWRAIYPRPMSARKAPSKSRSPSREKLTQWRERLARSSRFFLIGLIVACGIEVLIDWNATLFEINVLRDRMRERGYNYAGILAKSTVAPLAARDPNTLATLSSGLFDDADIAFVRFNAPDGTIVY